MECFPNPNVIFAQFTQKMLRSCSSVYKLSLNPIYAIDIIRTIVVLLKDIRRIRGQMFKL